MGFHEDMSRGNVVTVYDQDNSTLGRLALTPLMSIPKTIFTFWWLSLLALCSWKVAAGAMVVGYLVIMLSNIPWVLSGLRSVPCSDLTPPMLAALAVGEIVDVPPYGRVALSPRR